MNLCAYSMEQLLSSLSLRFIYRPIVVRGHIQGYCMKQILLYPHLQSQWQGVPLRTNRAWRKFPLCGATLARRRRRHGVRHAVQRPSRPQEARRALFFLRPNLGIEVGGSRGATEDNLKPKENADAKMSHSNLSPSRFEFVACTGRRLNKLNTKVSESEKHPVRPCGPPRRPPWLQAALSLCSAQLANH